jgi:hypothetical protein
MDAICTLFVCLLHICTYILWNLDNLSRSETKTLEISKTGIMESLYFILQHGHFLFCLFICIILNIIENTYMYKDITFVEKSSKVAIQKLYIIIIIHNIRRTKFVCFLYLDEDSSLKYSISLNAKKSRKGFLVILEYTRVIPVMLAKE